MKNIKKIIFTALFIALGVALPQALHMIPQAGSIFLPMHIPVLMCGLICGPIYGLICGIITPITSNFITGMPPIQFLPSMVCELAVYGLIAGLLMRFIKTQNKLINVYIALIGSMLCGRIVFGVLNSLIFNAGNYSMQIWLTASFVKALPGIIIQIVAIPAIIIILYKARVIEHE